MRLGILIELDKVDGKGFETRCGRIVKWLCIRIVKSPIEHFWSETLVIICNTVTILFTAFIFSYFMNPFPALNLL
jgi:hypothetical protein